MCLHCLSVFDVFRTFPSFSDRFMRLEKPRLRDEWVGTQKEKMKNMKILNQLEEQLKDTLAGDTRLLNDLLVTKKLAEIKKQYDEATET